jgi:hypothetical protein
MVHLSATEHCFHRKHWLFLYYHVLVTACGRRRPYHGFELQIIFRILVLTSISMIANPICATLPLSFSPPRFQLLCGDCYCNPYGFALSIRTHRHSKKASQTLVHRSVQKSGGRRGIVARSHAMRSLLTFTVPFDAICTGNCPRDRCSRRGQLLPYDRMPCGRHECTLLHVMLSA